MNAEARPALVTLMCHGLPAHVACPSIAPTPGRLKYSSFPGWPCYILLLPALLSCGCTRQKPATPLVQAAGMVLIGDAPASGIHIEFHAVETENTSARSFAAQTDSDGHFEMHATGTSGIPAGDYTVTVKCLTESLQVPVDSAYGNLKETPLKLRVNRLGAPDILILIPAAK